MEGARYVFVIFLVFGYVQCGLIKEDVAIVEELRRAPGARIVAGWPAEDGQIPYQINMRTVNPTGGVGTCGGSIIHHQWVLTAAHCLNNRVTLVVKIGLTNLTRPDYMIETTNIHIYPGYNQTTGGVQTHDIGLLGLDYWLDYTEFIQPCRLANSAAKHKNYDRIRFTMSGFGRMNDFWLPNGDLSETLRWVYLLGVTNEYCLTYYRYSQVIREQTICAASYNDTEQSGCRGDSGGPLTMVDVDGKPTMVGVLSFGHASGCNGPHPGGYVRPSWYHDWFYEITGINFDWNDEDILPKAEGSIKVQIADLSDIVT